MVRATPPSSDSSAASPVFGEEHAPVKRVWLAEYSQEKRIWTAGQEGAGSALTSTYSTPERDDGLTRASTPASVDGPVVVDPGFSPYISGEAPGEEPEQSMDLQEDGSASPAERFPEEEPDYVSYRHRITVADCLDDVNEHFESFEGLLHKLTCAVTKATGNLGAARGELSTLCAGLRGSGGEGVHKSPRLSVVQNHITKGWATLTSVRRIATVSQDATLKAERVFDCMDACIRSAMYDEKVKLAAQPCDAGRVLVPETPPEVLAAMEDSKTSSLAPSAAVETSSLPVYSESDDSRCTGTTEIVPSSLPDSQDFQETQAWDGPKLASSSSSSSST
jgi:hypothetical protein